MAGRPPLRIGQHGKITRVQVGGGLWLARCRFRDLDRVPEIAVTAIVVPRQGTGPIQIAFEPMVVPEHGIEEVLQRTTHGFPELGGTGDERAILDPRMKNRREGIHAGLRPLQLHDA